MTTQWTDDHKAGYQTAQREATPRPLAEYASWYRQWCEAREASHNARNHDYRDGFALAIRDAATAQYGIDATRAAFHAAMFS